MRGGKMSGTERDVRRILREIADMIEADPPAEPEPRRCPDCGMEIPGEWHFCPPEAKQGKAQEDE